MWYKGDFFEIRINVRILRVRIWHSNIVYRHFLRPILAYQGSKWGSKKFFQGDAPWVVVSCGKNFLARIWTFGGYFRRFYPNFSQKTGFWQVLGISRALVDTLYQNYRHIIHQMKDLDEIFTTMYNMIHVKLLLATYWAKNTRKRGKNDPEEPPCHLEITRIRNCCQFLIFWRPRALQALEAPAYYTFSESYAIWLSIGLKNLVAMATKFELAVAKWQLVRKNTGFLPIMLLEWAVYVLAYAK